MTTLEIELAMMSELNFRQNVIVPNVQWGICIDKRPLHECDLLMLTKSGYAREIEIKISRADLRKDKEKRHGHDHPAIKELWFAVPEKLQELALEEIPARAGLYVVNDKGRVRAIRNATANKEAIKWSDKDRMQLMRLGAMRIYTLKKNIRELRA